MIQRNNIYIPVLRLIVKYVWLILISFTFYSSIASSQDSLSFEERYLLEYEQNIQKESIDGVYIPKNLNDSFRELMRLSDPGSLQKFKEAGEEEVSTKLHFGLGRWISAKWKFYEGSRFSHYLKSLGISHPDDMVQFTIVSFHRYLNGVDLNLDQRAKYYKESREKEQLARLENGKLLKIDTLENRNN